MQQILVYADSLSWGIVPDTRRRWPFTARWPGVMERALVNAGHDARVSEDCLNGRRTVWEDPFKGTRLRVLRCCDGDDHESCRWCHQHQQLGLAMAGVVGPILRRASQLEQEI